jgi:hypothetical protein
MSDEMEKYGVVHTEQEKTAAAKVAKKNKARDAAGDRPKLDRDDQALLEKMKKET